MAEPFDNEKIVGYLFDPDVSSILSELEESPRDSDYLSGKLEMTPEEIKDKLSYLIEHGFVSISGNAPETFSVDGEKLAKAMEHDENYQSAVDGLTKLDGFLN